MLKNNKGITLMVLVVMVIVLLILSTVGVYGGMSAVNNSKYYNAISQMKVMQSNVNQWYEKYKNGESSGWDLGKDISETESEKQEKAAVAFASAYGYNLTDADIGSISDYKYFDVDCITDDLDIEGIGYDFIINIKTRTVILIEGVTYNGVTYYSLGEIEGEQYNVEYEGVVEE